MKAKDVRSATQRALAGPLTRLGFRARRQTFVRKAGGKTTCVWVPIMPGYDRLTGGEFLIELADDIEPGAGLAGRLPKLLLLEELREMRERNNTIVARLPEPTAAELDLVNPAFRSAWRPVAQGSDMPLSQLETQWFRFIDERDVEGWCEWLAPLLPECIEAFEMAVRPPPARLPDPSLRSLRERVHAERLH